MTDPDLRVALDDFNTIPADPPGPEGNGAQPTVDLPAIAVESWHTFERQATETVPCIVDGLWPVGALGFVAAPPKKGKTWLGLSLALSVATGRRCLARFDVPKRQPVLYVALEGHRAALRGRVGCLARGIGIDPDGDELEGWLHFAYKPRGINIADPQWANALCDSATQTEAGLVVVDVLRAAASLKENDAQEFAALRRNLLPMLDQGHALALLHHFGKLTEITKERSPGERMSGSGAMYGAMDVGVFITGSDDGARRLRLEFELRDLAEPETLGLHLTGEGNGENDGFTYRDTARWTIEEAPDETVVKAPADEIYALIQINGGAMTSTEILGSYENDGTPISDRTLRTRDHALTALGIDIGRGPRNVKLYRIKPPQPEQLALPSQTKAPETEVPEDFRGQLAPGSQPAILHDKQPTPEVPETDNAPGSESADLQAFGSRKYRHSPTESDTPLPGSAHRDDFDPPDNDETKNDWAT